MNDYLVKYKYWLGDVEISPPLPISITIEEDYIDVSLLEELLIEKVREQENLEDVFIEIIYFHEMIDRKVDVDNILMEDDEYYS